MSAMLSIPTHVHVACSACGIRYRTRAEVDGEGPFPSTMSEEWPEPPEVPIIPLCRSCLGLRRKLHKCRCGATDPELFYSDLTACCRACYSADAKARYRRRKSVS